MLRSVIAGFVVRLISAVLNFLIIVLLSQELGAAGKGVCSMYITIIANGLIFCDLLGGPSVVYLSARYRALNMLLPSYTWSILTSAIVMSFFLFTEKITSYEFVFLTALSFLNSAVAVHQNILSGKMKFKKLNFLMLFQSVLMFSALKFFTTVSGAQVNDYVWALGLAFGLTALVGFFFVMFMEDTAPTITVFRFAREAFGFGMINTAGHFLQFFNQRLSYFLLSDRLLGVFSNAMSLGESLWLIPNSIATVQYGKLSNITNERDAVRITLPLLKLNFFLTLFAALILVLLPDSFFVWLFGSEFSGIHDILFILSPGLVCYSAYLIIGHHFSGTGKFARNLFSIAGGLFVTLFCVLYYHFKHVDFTLKHAAMITSGAAAANFVFALFIFMKKSDVHVADLLPHREDLVFLRTELKKRNS